MDFWLIWTCAIPAVILGIHGAYYGALHDACLQIGTGLEGASDGTTGFQDAITPPSSTTARMRNWIATLLIAGGSWYYIDTTGVAIFLVVRFVATVVSGAALKADPPKNHFCHKVYRSMANREADYAKAGDNIRSQAMKDLRTRFESSKFATQLTQ